MLVENERKGKKLYKLWRQRFQYFKKKVVLCEKMTAPVYTWLKPNK